jgi:tRNA(Ile)-lysidine synthase
VSRSSDKFSPEWLGAHLQGLLPGYPEVSLCVALSGGVDSTALLVALARATRPPTRLRALHIDHGLRPASKEWAARCRSLARRLRVPLKVLTTRVARAPGESLEAVAREARYRLLASELRTGEILLTAHHCDDQLETVVLQLLRGSGLPGLAGMPARAAFASGWLARPLLSRSRAELEVWARGEGLSWVEDDSNVDESLDRNYLRRRILPFVRERWPGSAAAVARSARHVAEAQSLLDELARADVDRASYGESLSVKALRALPLDRRRNALRFWITRAGYLAPDTRRLEEIAGPLIAARPDANPFVEWGTSEIGPRQSDAAAPARGGRVQRYGDLFSLSAARARAATTLLTRSVASDKADLAVTATATDLLWSWRASPRFDLPDDLGSLELVPDARGAIDLDLLPEPVSIRWRAGGERLSPRRGGPRRALKNLLQEARVPVMERARLPLLFSGTPQSTTGEAKLVAVADLLLDESVQATPAARHRARLRWRKSSRSH